VAAGVDEAVVPEPDVFDVAGDGETMAAVVAELGEDAAVADDDATGDDGVLAEVVVVELDPLANGSREA
jgi:hypothetical protein